MPAKRMNKWINLGLISLSAFALVILLGVALIDTPSAQLLPWWGKVTLQVMGYLYIVLPIFSLCACLYGWYTIDRTKEKGILTAIVVIIFAAVNEMIMLFSLLGGGK